MALHTYHLAGDEPPDLRGHVPELMNDYSQRAAQCIWASNLTSPDQDSLVCFHLYWVSEFFHRSTASVGMWMMQSLLIRKAILMGYHRDPKCFPQIKPLDAELRRRTWHAICQSDLLLSFHLGLPSMIDYGETDVASPRSLHEEELYEQMDCLPPERPMTEPTPVSYTIAKQKVFQVFGKVVRHVNQMHVPSDEQVDQLNRELIETYANTYPHLRKKPWEDGLQDSPEIRLQRISMQGFYNKAICVLNRRFITTRGTTEFALQCRALCTENALELLETQEAMQTAGYRWDQLLYMRNDFLLATVIICLALYTSKRPEHHVQGPWDPMPLTEESRLKQILDRARQIWIVYTDKLPDARRACLIVDTMVQKMETGNQSSTASTIDSSLLGNHSTTSPLPSTTPDSMQELNFDWSSWDTIIQGANQDMSIMNFENMWQFDGLKM
ncbi:MAG: hypothetical protein LQ340_001620 [Diploschistes diacapsis]|nr:MAG: hypothetical protein LQ340_001620 [Diploschistes diacapsis]